MSAESDTSKAWRDSPINPNRRYGDRFAANTLADQQVEAATRELRGVFEEAEAHPGDRRLAGDAIRSAWQVLMMVGFSDFDEIRRVNTEDWSSIIDPKQHALVSLALEIVGWYQFGLRPYDIDRTARMFDRALELTPHNQRALERFAIVANEIQPSHNGGLAKFPKKQKETALGYRLQCKRKIDNILHDVFGITEAHLVGQAEQTVASVCKTLKDRDRKFVFSILGHLSRINLAVGEFFGNGTQLSLGMGAACCQLEMLGYSRDVSNALALFRSQLEEHGQEDVAGEETPLVRQILASLASLCESKWTIFQNRGAQRRAAEIRGFLARLEDSTANTLDKSPFSPD
jgi:hypothetical protein